MSYILDALRRADAERERDPSRGIHAQPAAGLPVATRRPTPVWAWGAGLAVLAIAAGAWWMGQQTRAAPVRPVVVASRPMVDLTTAAPARVVVPVAASVSPPAPEPLPAPAPVAERPVAKAAVAAAAAPVKAAPAKPATPVAAGTPAPAPVPAQSATAVAPPVPAAVAPVPAPTAPPAERIVAVGDLPADVQRELPKLVISGGVHSENASQRLLIVGGQVMTEGAEVAPGVMLEQIRARTAVMRYRGFKYSVPY